MSPRQGRSEAQRSASRRAGKSSLRLPASGGTGCRDVLRAARSQSLHSRERRTSVLPCNLNYHWLFWIPLVLIAVTTVATVLVIPEAPVRAPGNVNWGGAVLLSLWLIFLLLAISEAPTWGWLSARTLALWQRQGSSRWRGFAPRRGRRAR